MFVYFTCSLRFWSDWRCRGVVSPVGEPSPQCYCPHSDSRHCSVTEKMRQLKSKSLVLNDVMTIFFKPVFHCTSGKQYHILTWWAQWCGVRHFSWVYWCTCKDPHTFWESGTTGPHLSCRWELLALCRGLEVMLLLLPVTLLAPVTMGEPELWVRLWIIVWASSASSTTSLISCSCWSLVLLLGDAAAEVNCTAPPTAHAEPEGCWEEQCFWVGTQRWVERTVKRGILFLLLLNNRNKFVTLACRSLQCQFFIFLHSICKAYLFWPLCPMQQQSQEQKELRVRRLKVDMVLVWHLVCTLEPLQKETLSPEERTQWWMKKN